MSKEAYCEKCLEVTDLDMRFDFPICFDCVEIHYQWVSVDLQEVTEDLLLGEIIFAGEEVYEWFRTEVSAKEALIQRKRLFPEQDWTLCHTLSFSDNFDGWHLERYA